MGWERTAGPRGGRGQPGGWGEKERSVVVMSRSLLGFPGHVETLPRRRI